MYVAQPGKSVVSEELLDCPFTQLGLVHTAGDSRHYTFRVGHKPTLAAEIIVYACLSYACRFSAQVHQIPISLLLYDSGSPGLVFKLTESTVCEAIEKIARRFKQIGISDAAGKLEFFYDDDPVELADSILDEYYA
jgi:hypothetical protein